LVSSVTTGCLKADEEAEVSSSPPATSPVPEESSEAEDSKSDEQAEPKKEPASADDKATPKVKVTLGGLSKKGGALDVGGKKGKSRDRSQEGEVPGAPKKAPSDPAELAAIATGSKLSEKDVREVAEAHLDDIGKCYARESGEGPLHMEVRLTVGPTGLVQDASVEVKEAAESMKECVVKAVGSWEFPPPEGGGVVKLRYPFTLQPID